MKNSSVNVLSASDSANHNGIQIDASQVYAASFHGVFGDSSASGTLKVQASNDILDSSYLPQSFNVINWIDIPSASAAVTAGAPVLITITTTAYRWMRVVYTGSGGTTTVNVNMFTVCL